MLNVKASVVTALKANSALTSLLRLGADSILFEYPDSFELVPLVTYREVDQRDYDYADDVPIAFESIICIDVYTGGESTSTIASAVDNVMHAEGFVTDSSSDVPEPDTKYRHRTMYFRRFVTAVEL